MAGSPLRIGTSGWSYPSGRGAWTGIVYPKGGGRRAGAGKIDELSAYAEHFDTVEINNTFYRLPAPEVFESWHRAAPAGFCYAVKFNRFGTHFKKLMDAPATIGRFLEAAREFEAGYAAAPRTAFLLNIGHCYRRAGQLEKAKSYYKKLLETDPGFAQRGEVEEHIRNIDDALSVPQVPAPKPEAKPLPAPRPELQQITP